MNCHTARAAPSARVAWLAEHRGWPGCEVRSDPCLPMGWAHQRHPQGTSHELPHHHRVQEGECREHLLWSSCICSCKFM